MKLNRNKLIVACVLSLMAMAPVVTSCGSLHSYWGVENDYYYGDDGQRHPKKHKKHKKDKKHHHPHNDYY